MGNHQTVEPDPQELERANNMWESFTKVGKYSIYATVIVLVLMALAFIR